VLQYLRVPISLVTLALGLCLFLPGLTRPASAAIYWTHGDSDAGIQEVGRANLDGSNADPAFIAMEEPENDVETCGGLAIDAAHIYWANDTNGTIGRADLDGSEVNQRFITGLDHPCGLSIDASYIYWTSSHYSQEHGAIGRAGIDGAHPQAEFLKTAYPPCAVATSGAYLFGPSLDPENLAAGIFQTASNGGGTPALLVPHVETGCGIAVSGEYIYWTNPEDGGTLEGAIGRSRVDGSQVEPRFIGGLEDPTGLAIHENEIYWTEAAPIGPRGAISRVGIDGSNVQKGIVSSQVGPFGIAVDNAFAPPVPPKPEAVVGEFSIASIKHSRRGATFVALKASVPGSLAVRVSKGIRWKLLGGSMEVGPGLHWLKFSAGPGAQTAWPHSALRRKGRALFSVTIAFVPKEGPSKSIVKRISISQQRS
jgi:hypothetical protein